MLSKRIIYQNTDGGVASITPNLVDGQTVEEIAQKDVPTGAPFKIIEIADLPADRELRDAWTVDPADLTDGVGA